MTPKFWLIFLCALTLVAQTPPATAESSPRDMLIAKLAADPNYLDEFAWKLL